MFDTGVQDRKGAKVKAVGAEGGTTSAVGLRARVLRTRRSCRSVNELRRAVGVYRRAEQAGD